MLYLVAGALLSFSAVPLARNVRSCLDLTTSGSTHCLASPVHERWMDRDASLQADGFVIGKSLEQPFVYDSAGAYATDARRSILGFPSNDPWTDTRVGQGMGSPVPGHVVSGSQPGFGPSFLYTQHEMYDKFAPGMTDASYAGFDDRRI